MAVNKNTRQNPIASGKTGAQVVKFIPAPRVYIKAEESLTAAPVQNYQKKTQSTGDLDASYTGWTDLGIVQGNAKLTYEKKIAEVRTGLDDVLRATYVQGKTATLEFNLQQFDDVALEAISGLTASVITSGSVVNYQIGQEDIVQKAILLVLTSKVDGKEIQLYNPAAFMSFNFDEADNGLVYKVTASLPAFTAAGTLGSVGEGFFSKTIFSA